MLGRTLRSSNRGASALGTTLVSGERRLLDQSKDRNVSQDASSEIHGSSYVDEWYPTIIKPAAFYEYHANNSSNKMRSYFYNVDLHGRLFLEETLPKNVATSIKDDRFLDFFFRRIRPHTTVSHHHHHHPSEWAIEPDDYPYVSVCTKYETNYIRPVACPIVFHSLVPAQENDTTTLHLIHAGSLATVFSPHALAVSPISGRLYHRLASRRGHVDSNESSSYYGLIRSSVVVQLSEELDVNDDDGRWVYTSSSNDERILLPWLPCDHEPGLWGMPTME